MIAVIVMMVVSDDDDDDDDKIFNLVLVAFQLSFLVDLDYGKVQGARVHFPAITLQIPALCPTGAGELSGSDPVSIHAVGGC